MSDDIREAFGKVVRARREPYQVSARDNALNESAKSTSAGATTLSRVTDQAVWDTSVEHAAEIQIPTAWTNDEVSFMARKGEFGSLVGKYLLVVKSDGTPVRGGV